MFLGDNLFRWDKKADAQAMPDLATAVQQYVDPAKHAAIQQGEKGEEIPWNSWEVKLWYAPQEQFANPIDFLINIPALHPIEETAATEDWYWNPLPDNVTLDKHFSGTEIQNLLFGKKISGKIKQGWILRKTYGRIDEDTTYAHFSYLIAAGTHYLYITNYQETLH